MNQARTGPDANPSSRPDQCFDVVFPARESEARKVLKRASQFLRNTGMDSRRAGEVEIALAEAVNNIVEHAYGCPGRGLVHVTMSLQGNEVVLRLTDTGRPMPGGALPGGRPANLAVPRQRLPEGGFGWFLIRTLADHVRHERRDGMNMLTLRFRL